jgi:hypothetical protein
MGHGLFEGAILAFDSKMWQKRRQTSVICLDMNCPKIEIDASRIQGKIVYLWANLLDGQLGLVHDWLTYWLHGAESFLRN